jgi:uncharacterized protein (DUF1015 family)
MARLYPFRALRYDPTLVDMTSVVTQPYDKITPAMQDAYYASSPYNLIRVILGKHKPTDTDADNVYTRAAATLTDWRTEGILKEESEPALYGYSQTYSNPNQKEEILERRGFIALGHLHDYADHVVYRHEQTFPKHKSDRLALFKATRAYCEQIYMLYSDPTFTAEHIIFDSGTTPDLEITDEYSVLHRLWKLTDPTLITRVLATMADKKLIIADGHHRYETSTTYMHERAAELGLDSALKGTGFSPSVAGKEEQEALAPASTQVPQGFSLGSHTPAEEEGALTPESTHVPQGFSLGSHTPAEEEVVLTPESTHVPQGFSLGSHRLAEEEGVLTPESAPKLPVPPCPEAAMMMTFVNMDAPGITILPTHRVAFNLSNFNGRDFAAKASAYFTVTEIHPTLTSHYPGATSLLQRLNDTPGVAFIAATRDGDFLLVPKPDAVAPLLSGLSDRQQQLDVTQLHKVVLEHLLGLSEETVRAGSNIRYLREAADALQQLGCGNADAVFLIKPVTLDQMRDISLNLEVMPQKSTDFYPKLLSGLAMYALD